MGYEIFPIMHGTELIFILSRRWRQ